MPLILLSHFLARTLGFRHRDSDTFYRMSDVIGGFWLLVPILAVQSLLSGGAHWLLPPSVAAIVVNVVGVLMTALSICAITLWMPLIEHYSLHQPGDLHAGGRRLAVWLARAIPYVYGLIALAFALVMAALWMAMISLALIGFSNVLPGPNAQDVPPWLVVLIGVLFALLLFGLFLRVSQADTDWGLPMWRSFVEPGQRRGAGAWLFDPLDRLIGRPLGRLTRPKPHEVAAFALRERADAQIQPSIQDWMLLLTAAIIPLSLLILLVSALEYLTGWPLGQLFVASSARQPGTAPQTNPTEVAGVLLMMIVTLGSLVGIAIGFVHLAERSRDAAWAQRPVVRALAAILRVLLYLADPLIGLIAGSFGLIGLAMLYGGALPPPWLVGTVFVSVALLMTWAARQIPKQTGVVLTIIENVRTAQDSANAPVQ